MPVEIKQHDNLNACLILTMANEYLWSDQIRGKINRESIAFHFFSSQLPSISPSSPLPSFFLSISCLFNCLLSPLLLNCLPSFHFCSSPLPSVSPSQLPSISPSSQLPSISPSSQLPSFFPFLFRQDTM